MPGAILLVEDDPVLGPLLETMLKAGGHGPVLLAPDAPQAIAAARRFPGDISLLVTDVGLPSLRGDLLARAVVDIHPDVRVVLISGYRDDGGRPPGAPSSWRMLEKPLSVERLLAAVNAAFADH